VRYTRAPFAPPGFPDPEMGAAADDLADARSIGRERQDAYAARSHRRALAAAQAGRFDAEIVAVKGISTDQRPRPLTTERLARLRPAFRPGGTVTAGNASGISDGAAAVAVTTAAAARSAGLPALAIRSCAVVAGDPALPGAAAGPAARQALQRAGLRIGDIGAIEVTEAFAAVALAFADDLGVADETLCPDGGAIALGHPWGASGALLLVRLLSRMLTGADRPEFGLAACAIGGGQGIAMVVQRLDFSGPAMSP
jgi:acetyl-CoA C-acetyltransferase